MKEVSRQNSIQNDIFLFRERVNALIESKYIIAEQKISSLLKGIVSISFLTDTVAQCLKNFSYATEFARNRMYISDGNQAKLKMTLPADKTRLFTFVFCLLAEIDAGERDLTKFLNEYFDAESPNDGYKMFCEQIIIPFKKAGENILKEADPGYGDDGSEQKGFSFFDAETVYVPSGVNDMVLNLLGKTKIRLDNDFGGSGEQHAECAVLLDALLNAFMSKNPKLIGIIWIGFKNTFGLVGGFEKEMEEIKNILTDANLV